MENKVKKAVVVGGSNGMGLAVSVELLNRGYFVEIADLTAPDEEELEGWIDQYSYSYTNLLDFDEDLFRSYAEDRFLDTLVITAGIGRIADFQYHHIAEIDKTFIIDSLSTIKILRIFYDRIMSSDSFYTAVMGSIAGWMSSPCASVYSAAKAGVVRLIEAVNIELEVYASPNRILDVSPSSFKGSRFYGGKNDLSVMSGLASEIVNRMFGRETRFIPQYEEIFKGVLDRYYTDPHEYGIHSYNYKESSGRKDNTQRVKVGYLCTVIKQIDINLINKLKEARRRCDYLIVGIKNNEDCNDGSNSIPLEELINIVKACRYVDRVIDGTMDISEAQKNWHINRLFTESDIIDVQGLSTSNI